MGGSITNQPCLRYLVVIYSTIHPNLFANLSSPRGSLRWTWMTTVWWVPSADTDKALKTLFSDKKATLNGSRNQKITMYKQPLCLLDTFLEADTSISKLLFQLDDSKPIRLRFDSYLTNAFWNGLRPGSIDINRFSLFAIFAFWIQH